MNTDTRMDMKIAGSGRIPAGEYKAVSVSGSGKLFGQVRCATFSSAGSCRGEALLCEEICKVSGSASFSENVQAASFSAAGSFACGGDLTVSEKLSCAGSVQCGGSVVCHELSVAGLLKVGGGIEAESVKVKGTIACEGLLNAESIDIAFDNSGTDIDSVGGSSIAIYPRREGKTRRRFSLLSLLRRPSRSRVYAAIKSSVEGDEIHLTSVVTPRVTGRVVVIGSGCDIELVQYSERVDISPDAKVQRTEKV